MEEEHLAAASTASKAMAMMQRLQKENAEVQVELRRFAAKIDHLRALIARRAHVRYRLHAYQQTGLRLSIPLLHGDEAEGRGHGDDDGWKEGIQTCIRWNKSERRDPEFVRHAWWELIHSQDWLY